MKAAYLFASIFILAINLSTFGQGWQQVLSPQSNTHLYGVYFADGSTGLCGAFKTTNTGQSWYQPENNTDGYTMMFPVSNTGYFSGVGVIFKTINTGDSWIQQSLPTGAIMYSTYFVDANTGYANGESAKIVKTTNGGANWTLLASPLTSDYLLYGTYFINAVTGFVCGYEPAGYGSVILKTTDGGANWSSGYFGSYTGYSAMHFINSTTGVVIGVDQAKTTDGGATWQEVFVPGVALLHQLYFSSSTTGYAVGTTGNIIKTTNAGSSWFRQTTGLYSDLSSVYFINDNTGYVCGDNGILLKTTDGGGPPLGIQQVSGEIPKTYSLLQNYPNPFNPGTVIKFKVSEYKFVNLTIYDILGRVVATLVNENLKPGEYETEWNASNFASGVYFYQLMVSSEQATIYSQTKKLVLIK